MHPPPHQNTLDHSNPTNTPPGCRFVSGFPPSLLTPPTTSQPICFILNHAQTSQQQEFRLSLSPGGSIREQGRCPGGGLQACSSAFCQGYTSCVQPGKGHFRQRIDPPENHFVPNLPRPHITSRVQPTHTACLPPAPLQRLTKIPCRKRPLPVHPTACLM